jgi:mannose-6-phosphate isomerase-like protein (cupin superfamily)
VNGEEKNVGAGDIVIVPAGCEHNFIVTSQTPLVLFTVYSPAEHYEKTVHKTKDEGEELEDAGKDEPPKWAMQN